MLNRIKEYIDSKGISVSAFEKSIGMSNASFGKSLKNNGAIGSDKLENILSVYPDINTEWLLTGKGEMLKQESVKSVEKSNIDNNEETRPRIPYTAAAGSLGNALEGITENHCEQIPVIKAFARYDFTILVYGDSMLPEYHSGDELACLYIKNPSFIQWGRTHVLDTSQGIVVKRIFDNGDSIRCLSDNNFYKEFDIPKSEVYNLALIIGLVRRY